MLFEGIFVGFYCMIEFMHSMYNDNHSKRHFHMNTEGGGNGHAGSHFVRLFLWR